MTILRRKKQAHDVRRLDVAVDAAPGPVARRRRGWDPERLRAEVEAEFRAHGARVIREEESA